MVNAELIQSSRNLCKLAQILQSTSLSDDETSQELDTLLVANRSALNKTVNNYYAMSPLSTMHNEQAITLQKGTVYFFRDDLLTDLQKLPGFFKECLLSSGTLSHQIADYLQDFLLLSSDTVQVLMTRVCYLGKGVLRHFNIADSPPLVFGNSNASILQEIIKTECCILNLLIQLRSLANYSFQVYSALAYLLPAAVVSLEEAGYDSTKALSAALDVLLWESDDGRAIFYTTFRMAIFPIKQRNQKLYNRILQLIATKIDLVIKDPLKCMDTLLASDTQSSMQQTQFLILLHILCSGNLWDTLELTDKLKLELSIQTYYTMLVKELRNISGLTTNPNYMYEVHLLIQFLGLKYSIEIHKN
ncbi:Hypothetical protein GLP15_1013 [Giardia lamblia P15]|uniref:Uncharacterized protein n=1 Tax=Giardia intestinalis (strain P15) TaxID=658858 RepID=E1F319_GIAIA|nr:Hypothetical protein GLP15_1013 [Giardia lamblia P15]